MFSGQLFTTLYINIHCSNGSRKLGIYPLHLIGEWWPHGGGSHLLSFFQAEVMAGVSHI
jgi:hypothetical protein